MHSLCERTAVENLTFAYLGAVAVGGDSVASFEWCNDCENLKSWWRRFALMMTQSRQPCEVEV